MTAPIPHACSKEAFDDRYRQSRDPWAFSTSQYERHRYATIVAALTRSRYHRAFEPGCSIGELTAQLARRCGHVIATDLSPRAVELARERCALYANVDIYEADLANGPPIGPFDLVVLSEVGYYFSRRKLIEVALACAAQLAPEGEFLAVHWLGHSPDHVLYGDEVHEILATNLPLQWIEGSRHTGFRIDTWKRA
jgi:SAM-dependent methyltransferase